jgi:hypothetical protein
MQQKLKKAYLCALTIFLVVSFVYINISIRSSYKNLRIQITNFYNADFHHDQITSITELQFPHCQTSYKVIATDRSLKQYPLLVLENGNIDSIKIGYEIHKDAISKIFTIKNERNTFQFTLQNVNTRIIKEVIPYNISYCLLILILVIILYFIPSKYLATSKI